MRIPLHVAEEVGAARAGEVVAGGVPLPAGLLLDPASVRVLDPAGRALPCHAEAFESWPDASVRWLRVEFCVWLAGQRQATWTLVVGDDAGPADDHAAGDPWTDERVEIEQHGEEVTMRCGEVVVAAIPGGPFAPLRHPGLAHLQGPAAAGALELAVTDGSGTRYTLRTVRAVEVVRAGPLSATVRLHGDHTAGDGHTFLDAEVEITLRAGSGEVVVDHRIVNREAPDVVELRAWEARVGTGPTRAGACGMFNAVHRSSGPFALVNRGDAYHRGIFATSVVEGGTDWVEISLPDYREAWEWIELEGRHGSNWIHAGDDAGGTVVAVPQFVENHPSRLAYERDGIRVGFYPAQEQAPLVLVQGMARRQRLVVRPGAGGPVAERTTGARVSTPLAFHTGAWSLATGALPPVLRFDPARRPRLEALARAELFSWYLYGQSTGLLDYGDCVTPDPMGVRTGFSANNEEDALWALLLHWLRSGERAVLEAATAYADHTVDVDQIHHSTRNPFEAGGVRAHGRGHLKYARARTPAGVVESSIDTGHMWVEGLLLAGAVTGDERYRDAAVAVGECFLRLIRIGWARPEPGPRNSGWTLIALAALYRSTGEPRWLEGARGVAVDAVKAQGADGRWTMRSGFHRSFCAWQNAVLLVGLDRLLGVDPVHDESVAEVHARGCRALVELGRHPDGTFVYMDRYEYRWVAWHGLVHEALAGAYRRSGEKRFLEAGMVGGAAWLAHPGVMSGRPTLSNDVAQWRGHLQFYAAAEEAGLLTDLGLDHVR